MPRVCTVCVHPELAEINKALLLRGGSKSECSVRYGLSAAAIQRHRSGCLGHKPRQKQLGASNEGSDAGASVRFGSLVEGRCAACGTVIDDPKPEALVKRAERVLSYGEQIMQKAIADEDFRLGLAAIDRARLSLEQLLKVHGLLAPEGATVVVKAEAMTVKRAFAIVLDAVPETRRGEALAVWTRFLSGESSIAAREPIQVSPKPQPALPK